MKKKLALDSKRSFLFSVQRRAAACGTSTFKLKETSIPKNDHPKDALFFE